jgi:hypothetical protein
MNRNASIVLALVVIGALVLGAIYIPQYLEDSRAVSSSVEFYDADGDLIPLAIYAGGAEVVTMTVKARWTVDTTDIDPASFNARIRVDIAVLSLSGVYEQVGSATLNSDTMVQTTYVVVGTWVLADMLQAHMSGADKMAGWTLRIRADLTPTATDVAGNPVTPDPPTQDAATVTAVLTWVTTTASMTIISVEVNRWLVP